MGLEVTASCSCGTAEVKMAIGTGVQFSGCYFPCLCEACRGLVRVDITEKSPRCPGCGSSDLVPYDDPKLTGSSGDVIVHCSTGGQVGRDLELTDGSYYCPSCGRTSLRFVAGWDRSGAVES